MPKFLVEMELDGYDNRVEMTKACRKLIESKLNRSGVSAKVTLYEGCEHYTSSDIEGEGIPPMLNGSAIRAMQRENPSFLRNPKRNRP